MQRLTVFRLIISIAAMIFVAKPFLGFGAFGKNHKPRISHTILVKSFSKRKTETQEEANAKAEFIRQAIANPLMILLSAISILISILLPSTIESVRNVTKRFIEDINAALLPPERAYLLSGKLTI